MKKIKLVVAIVALLVSGFLPHAGAVDPARDTSKKPAKKPADLKTLMTERGDLLFEEPFTEDSFAKDWNTYKGKFEVVKDQLRVAEVPTDGHHPETMHHMELKDCVIQFSFKLEGCKWMGLSFDDKEHIARAMLSPDSFTIVKMSGVGGTTKGVDIDRVGMKFDPKTWYTMLIEIQGNEMLAQINNETVLYGEAEGLDAAKSHIDLIAGGQYAWFSDLKVWEAQPNKNWAKMKSKVQAMKAARDSKKK